MNSEWEERCDGLTNSGNTCFMAALLQVLGRAPPVAAAVLATWLGNPERPILDALAGVILQQQQQQLGCLKSLRAAMGPPWTDRQQHDAAEFAGALHDELCSADPADAAALETAQRFRAVLRHTKALELRCSYCNVVTAKQEPGDVLVLNLPVSSASRPSIRGMLAKLFGIEAAIQRNCPSSDCPCLIMTVKTTLAGTPPEVLCLHVARFTVDSKGNSLKRKDHIGVEEHLDLAPYYPAHESADLRYTLVGLLCHDGDTVQCGHYRAAVKIGGEGWRLFDDETSTAMSEAEVQEMGASGYIFMYALDTAMGAAEAAVAAAMVAAAAAAVEAAAVAAAVAAVAAAEAEAAAVAAAAEAEAAAAAAAAAAEAEPDQAPSSIVEAEDKAGAPAENELENDQRTVRKILKRGKGQNDVKHKVEWSDGKTTCVAT